MLTNKEVSKEKQVADKIRQFIKKNGLTVLMLIVVGLMFFNPGAKAFVLRQLMTTGFFNAKIEKKGSATAIQTDIDFDFADEKGKIRNTSSLKGKVVFINFWASWCPPCRAEFPSIETLYSKFKDNPDVFFLTINEDSHPGKARDYLTANKYKVPLFVSKGIVPVEIYSGILPTTVVLDKYGKIRYHNTGFANYASDGFVKQIEAMILE